MDVCDTTTGCSNEPDNTYCDTGDLCDGVGTCDTTQGCLYADIPDCDDEIACTIDGCTGDSTGYECTHQPDDTACNDDIDCTADACILGEGCNNVPDDAICDDGFSCTFDLCDDFLGECKNYPDHTICADNNVCTIEDLCNPTNAEEGNETGCVYTDIAAEDLDDDNICTEDTCDPTLGAIHTPLPGTDCSDGEDCTEGDTCGSDGLCKPGDWTCATCPEGEPCSDGDPCTINDTCNDQDECIGGETDTCDDGIICTNDSCDPDNGCVHEPDNSFCNNDDDVCNGREECHPNHADAGLDGCVEFAPIDCGDNDPCTLDICNPDTGNCSNPSGPMEGLACDDDNECTVDTICTEGLCSGGSMVCTMEDVVFELAGKEYLASGYDNRLTWSQSAAFCREWGGDLMTVNSEAEMNLFYGDQYVDAQNTWWNGLNDLTTEGDYEWLDPEGGEWIDANPTWAEMEDMLDQRNSEMNNCGTVGMETRPGRRRRTVGNGSAFLRQ